MLELILVRHGQTAWNVERKVMGRQPVPMNAEGRAQSRMLAKGLKEVRIDAVYTSPTKRTMQTAQILLKGRDSIPLVQEDGLAEIEFGEWLNKNFMELLDMPLFHDYLVRPSVCQIPGGERVLDVQKRALEVVERVKTRHAGQRVMLLSHADVVKSILVHFLNIPFDDWQRLTIDSGSMSVIQFKEDRTKVVTVNCQSNWGRYFK